jgi:hypothetical protein
MVAAARLMSQLAQPAGPTILTAAAETPRLSKEGNQDGFTG